MQSSLALPPVSDWLSRENSLNVDTMCIFVDAKRSDLLTHWLTFLLNLAMRELPVRYVTYAILLQQKKWLQRQAPALAKSTP